MKRIVAIVLVFSMAFSVVLAGASMVFGTEKSMYSDIGTGNWAYDSVSTMSGNSIVKGYPDGSFRPNNTVSYGEFIKMALIADTGKDVGNAGSGHWASLYYNEAIQNKYFTDREISTFRLDRPINRSDMALIVSSILGDVNGYDAEAIINGFSDVNPRRPHAGHIAKAYYSGIITGYNDGTFKPDATLTRAEASTVIHRLIDSSKRAAYVPPAAVSEEKLPLREMIKNLDSFVNPGDGLINDYLPMAKDYTIIKDPSVYKMSLKTNRGTNWIEVENANNTGMIFYVKDNYVIELPQTSPGGDGSRAFVYKTDITKVDYILSLNPIDGYMDLIVNPFKK